MSFPSLRRAFTSDNLLNMEKDEVLSQLVPLDDVPSTQDYYERANNFLEKQKSQKFFIETEPESNIVQDYMKNEPKIKSVPNKNFPSLINHPETKLTPKRPSTKKEKRYSTPIPKTAFDIDSWRNQETFLKALDEIRNLPFTLEPYRDESIKQFNDQMINIIIEMHSAKLINPFSRSHVYSKSAINYFNSAIKSLRKRFIGNLISKNRIITDFLNSTLRMEFIIEENKPIEEPKAITEEKLMKKQINEITSQFPPSYQPHIETLPKPEDLLREKKNLAKSQPVTPVKDSSKKLIRKKTTRSSCVYKSTPVIPLSHSSLLPKLNMSRSDLISTYFDQCDPLLTRTKSRANLATQLSSIADSANFEFDLSHEIDFEVPQIDIDVLQQHDRKNIFEEKLPEYSLQSPQNEEEEKAEEIKVDLMNKPRSTAERDATIKMLMSSPLIASLLSDENVDENLHERLNSIFDEFGFSTKQRIEIAVKYSDYESNGLSMNEAVLNWEAILKAVKNYDAVYKGIKESMKTVASSNLSDETYTNHVRLTLNTAENNVKAMLNRYREMIGGHLVIRGNDIEYIFSKRNKKLNNWLKNGN